MKKIFICLMTIMVVSCSLPDNESTVSTLEVLPIESASLPQYFEFGQTYEINLTYIPPTDCYSFNDFYYQSNGSERTIAVIASVFPGTGCQTNSDEVEKSFNFHVNSTSTYTFKFWQGEDADGNDIYLTMEVPVE